MISEQNKLALNVSEAAAMLGISRPTMYQLCRRVDFPSLRIGKRTLISREGLEKWLQQQTAERD